jgi:RNA polymerase sigma-B factor
LVAAADLSQREHERELFERLPDAEAREELLKLYQPLARYLARRFEGRGESLEDLTQVAALGLLKAIDRFDLERGVQFTTYAAATVIGELKRHFRDRGWAVRVPRRIQETGLRVSRAVSELNQELGHSPTVKEIGARTGYAEEEVLEALEASGAYNTLSLDAPVGGEHTTIADRVSDDDDPFDRVEGWASMGPAIRALPARERRMLYLRFFEEKTQSQIADEMGISQMHVSRLLARTLRQLREGGAPDDNPEGSSSGP